MDERELETRYSAGDDLKIDPGVVLGYPYQEGGMEPTRIGNNATIRAGTIIYQDVRIGNHLQTGHGVLIREKTRLGNHVVVGTNTVIDGKVVIGDFVKIESNCYIPTHVEIGNRVFLAPAVVLTNDRDPLRNRDSYRPAGPTIEDNVTIGAGAVVNPDLTIGAGSFIASGAVVTKDVPPGKLVKGVPGRISPLPDHLQGDNMALSWMKHLDNEE